MKSFNRDMKRELVSSLVLGAIGAGAACATVLPVCWEWLLWSLETATWLAASMFLPSVAAGMAAPSPISPDFNPNPISALRSIAEAGGLGGFLTGCIVLFTAIEAFQLIAWVRSYLSLHDGTFAGDRAPVSTHGDAALVSSPWTLRKRASAWREGAEPGPGILCVGSLGDDLMFMDGVHFLLRAGSGAGKSRRALAPSLAHAVASRMSIVVHDPKVELLSWLGPYIESVGGYETVAIRLDDPAKSTRWNPLDRAIAALEREGLPGAVAEISELAACVVPEAFGSSQKFFSDAARTLLEGLCLFTITEPSISASERNLSTVLALLAPRDGKSAACSLEAFASALPADNPARDAMLVASTNGGGGEGVVSTLRNYLMAFCSEDVAPALHDGEVDLSSIGRRPTAVFIASSTDRGNRGALVSCLFSQALSALRETAHEEGGRLPVETLLAIDEGSAIPKIPRLTGDLCEVRSIGLHVLMVVQNEHLLEARCGYSHAEAEALLSLFGCQEVLSIESLQEAEQLSRQLGDYSVYTSGESSTKGSQSSSSGKSKSITRRPLLTPSELMSWTARETGVLAIDAKGPMALPSKDITETFLGPLLGLTSRETERELLRAAIAGEDRNTGRIPVWRPSAAPGGARVDGKPGKRGPSSLPDGF